MTRMRWALLVVALTLVTAACGGDDGGVDVEGAWARTSPAMAEAGAVYMQITSADTDRLTGASVDPSVAAVVEIHETVMADAMAEGESSDSTMAEDEMGGAMMMQEVGEIPLPAGEAVALEPGGLHIMLLELAEPLETGESIEVTLRFETAGKQVVEVPVSDEAP